MLLKKSDAVALLVGCISRMLSGCTERGITVRRKLTTVALTLALLISAVLAIAAYAAKPVDKLEAGKAAFDKGDKQLAAAMFRDIVKQGKKNPAYDEACYNLGRTSDDPVEAMKCADEIYGSNSRFRGDAGISKGCLLWKKGDRLGAATQFQDVELKCPEKALDAKYHRALCLLGESVTNLKMRGPLRADGMKLLKQVARARGEHAWDAEVKLLAMRMEDAKSLKGAPEPLVADMEWFVNDSGAPDANKVTVLHMLAEQYYSPIKPVAPDYDKALTYAQRALEIAKDPVDRSWALLMKGVSLQAMGKYGDAISSFEQIISEFGYAEVEKVNMRGNDVVQNARDFKAECERALQAQDGEEQ